MFAEVVGQDHVVKTLQRAIEQSRLSHAYLFCGPRGVGKTTVARLLAKAVSCINEKERPCGKCKNCLDIARGKYIDLLEIDAASNRGIDDIRELRDKINFAPSIGKKKIYIIDEVHMLTREAFNALLKTLEEPPEHSLFIFATTEIDKVPQTILSRCQRFDFKLGKADKVVELIRKIAKEEKLNLSEEVAQLIASSSGGSFRDAQSLLDQISSHISGKETSQEEILKILNLSSRHDAQKFVEILKNGEAILAIEFIANLQSKGLKIGEFLQDCLSVLRDNVVDDVVAGRDTLWTQKTLSVLIEANGQMKISPIESLPLELAAIKICSAGSTSRPDASAPQDVAKPTIEEKKTAQNQGDSTDDNADASGGAEERSPQEKKQIKSLSSQLRQAFVDQVSEKNKPLGSLVSTAQMDYGDGVLKIFVEYPIHAAKIKSNSAIAILEGILKDLLNREVRIECEVCKEDELCEQIGEVFELS